MGARKLTVGVVLGSDLKSGGGYQYEKSVLDVLKSYCDSRDVSIICYSGNKQVTESHQGGFFPVNRINGSLLSRLHRFLLTNKIASRVLSRIGMGLASFEKRMIADGVDVVYFLNPNPLALCLNNLPFIFTLWDFGHLDLPEFPEISGHGEFEAREHLYSCALRKAFCVTVDSEYGKEQVINKYQLDSSRVSVLKFLPSANKSVEEVDVIAKYSLANDFVFYPAQFWPHKNHIYILDSIFDLKVNYNIRVDAAFSGADKGNLEYVLRKANEMGIADQIHYLGFVPQGEIQFLYEKSLALVMPTYLGPTNIPPLEALKYGVPVCYSDKESFRKQLGSAALYMDLNDPQSLSKHLLNILNGQHSREDLNDAAQLVLDSWNPKLFQSELERVFDKFNYIRSRWG